MGSRPKSRESGVFSFDDEPATRAHFDDCAEALIAQHQKAVQVVAESLAGLVDRFHGHGVSPLALMEGSLKASVIALAVRNGMPTSEIADLIEEAATCVRAMPADAFQETMQ